MKFPKMHIRILPLSLFFSLIGSCIHANSFVVDDNGVDPTLDGILTGTLGKNFINPFSNGYDGVVSGFYLDDSNTVYPDVWTDYDFGMRVLGTSTDITFQIGNYGFVDFDDVINSTQEFSILSWYTSSVTPNPSDFRVLKKHYGADVVLHGGVVNNPNDTGVDYHFWETGMMQDTYEVIWQDANDDGNIDQVLINFPSLVDILDSTPGDTFDAFSFTNGILVTSTGDYNLTNQTSVTLTLTGVTGTTSPSTIISYNSNADVSISQVGLEFTDKLTPTTVMDAAPPVVLSKEFKDTNLNGRIDQVEIVLSEDVTGVSMDDFIFNTAGYSFNSVSEIDGAITLGVQEISSKFDTYASLNMTIIANRIVDLYTNSPNDVLDAGIAFDLDDKAPPYLEVVPQSESTLSGFTIKGTVDDPDAKVFVEVEDATFATIDDTTTPPEWSIPGAVSNAGTYNVRVIASDAFSNVGQDTSIDELVIMGGLTITRADAPSVVCENSDYTTLSDLVFTEVGMGDFAIQSDEIMLIQAPEAFEFDTDVSTVTVSDDSGGSEVGITVSFIGTAILQLTLNVTGTTEMNIMRISDLKVTSTGDGKAGLQDMVRIAGDASVFGAGNGTVFGRMEDAPTPTNGTSNAQHALPVGSTFTLSSNQGSNIVRWYEPDGTTLIHTGGWVTAADLASSGYFDNTTPGLYTFRVTGSNTNCESKPRTTTILIYDDRDPSGNNSFINRTYNVTDPTDDIYMSNPSGHTVTFTSDGGGFNLVSTGDPIHAQFTPGTAGVQGGNPHSISYQITNDLTSETFTLVREFIVLNATLFTNSPQDRYCASGATSVPFIMNGQQFSGSHTPSLVEVIGEGLIHEATHGGTYRISGSDMLSGDNTNSDPDNVVFFTNSPTGFRRTYRFIFIPDEFAPPAGDYEIVRFYSTIEDVLGVERVGAEKYFEIYGIPDLAISNISSTYCSDETSFTIQRDLKYVNAIDMTDPQNAVPTRIDEQNQNITNGYMLYRSTDDGVTYTDLVGDFTGTNVQNTFNPNDPDQDGIIDADDIGFFRLEYTTGAVGAGACSVMITRDIKIFEQPDMPTLASDSYTDQNGVLTLQGNGDYFIEMCQFASLPTISLANGSPTDVTWYNSSQVAIVGFKDSVNIPADQLGFILDANGVLSAEQLGLEFYISTTSGDGCESELRKVRVNVYGKEDSPQLILGATFDEDDVRSGSRIFYSYELDYCTSTDGGNATANNLILPALGTGEKYTIGTSFDDGTNPGTYSTPTYADYTTNIIDLSSYVMAGGQSYKYEIYLEHDINVATGFMSCLSYITEVRTYGHNTPSAPTVADFNDGVLDYHVAEGNVLDPIFHANVGMDEYYWYEEDTRNTAFTNNPYSSGSPISVNAFKALLTSGKKLIVSNLNEAEDAGNDGVNDVYTYYVSRLDNKVGANDFDGCESNDNTAVSITVHTKQAAPSIVSDNTSGTQGQPVAFPNEKINNLGGNNEYHYSICVDQVESTLKFTTSQGIFGYYTNLSNGGVDRFTKGELITGQTSDATAYIAINNDAIGELSLINSAGTFTPNEQIVGASSGTTADLLSIHKFSGDSRFEWYAYTGGNGRGNLLYTGTSPTFVELQLSSITQAGNKFFEVIQVTDTDVFDGVESESTLVRVEFFASNNFKFTKISDEEYFCHDEVSVGSVDAQGRIQLALEIGGNAVMPTNLTYSVVSEPTDFADNLVVGSDNVIMDDIGAGGDGIGNPVINLKAWHLAAGGQEVGGEITSHTITMDYVQAIGGCAISKTFTIYIHPDPDITFTINGIDTDDVQFCHDDAKVHLAGFFATSPLSPLDAINGTFNYSGAGISDNNDGTATFDPSTAHGGQHAVGAGYTINFTYENALGCENTITKTLFVNPLPKTVDVEPTLNSSGHIQFDQICKGSPIDAFVQIENETDYSNYIFEWDLPSDASDVADASDTEIVERGGVYTETGSVNSNHIVFTSATIDFPISVTITYTGGSVDCSLFIEEDHTQQDLPEVTFTNITNGNQYCAEDTNLTLFMKTSTQDGANTNQIIGTAAFTDLANLSYSITSYRSDTPGTTEVRTGSGNPTINMRDWHTSNTIGGTAVGGYHTVHEITMTYQDLTDNNYQTKFTSCSNTASSTITIYPDPDISFTVNSIDPDAGEFKGDVDIVAPNHFCYDDGLVDLNGVFSAETINIPGYTIGSAAGTFTSSSSGAIVTTGTNTATFNPATAHGSDRFAVRSSHAITFTYTDQFGCQNDVTKTVFVNPLPDPIEIVRGREVGDQIHFSSICEGASLEAKVNLAGVSDYTKYTFNWILPADASGVSPGRTNTGSTNSNEISFSTTAVNFNTKVRVTNNLTGCEFDIDENHTQQPVPILSFSAIRDGNQYCAEDTNVTLSMRTSTQDGANTNQIIGTGAFTDLANLSYSITSYRSDTPETTEVRTGSGNPTINMRDWHTSNTIGGTAVGGYHTVHEITMTYQDLTDNNYQTKFTSCSNTASSTITIYPDPDISFTVNSINPDAGGFKGDVDIVAPNHFCYDEGLVDLNGVFSAGTINIPGYTIGSVAGTFTSSSSGAIVTTGTNTATFNPVTAHGSDRFAVRSSHTITFTYTDQFGCQNDVTETVFVNPLPEPVDDIVGGEIQFEALCRRLIKTAFVDIVGVTDYSNHTFVWELPGGSSYTGGGMVVNNAGQITITKTGDNTLDFDNDNSIFAISTIVTNNLTGCSIELTESETQGFSPEPSFTYVGITENSATGLDIQFFQDNPSLNNNDLTHLEFSLIGGPTTIAPIIRSGNGVSAFDLSDANITGLAAGEYTATITMKTIKGCEITAPRRVITILPIIDVGNPNIGGQYKEGFNGGYAHGWYIERASEDGKNDTMRISSWELVGAPGVVYTPYDTIVKHLDKKDPYEGDGMFITDWDDSYKPNEVSYVYSPAFDLDQFGNPAISFQHWRDFDSPRDGLTVQISGDDGRNWIGLGDNDLSSEVNWYTHQGVSSGPGEGARSPELATNPIAVGFADAVRDLVTNKAIVNWAESRQAINKASPDVNLIRFRFALAAGGGAKVTTGQVGGAEVNLSVADGFAFDDFKIYERNKRVLVEQFSSSLDAESKRNEFFIQEGEFENGTDGLPQNPTARKHTINWMDGTSGIWINYYTDVFNKGMQRDAVNARNKVDPATRSTLYGVSGAPVTRVGGNAVTYNIDTNPEDFGNGFDAISLEAPDFLIPNTDFVLDASASNDVISGSAKFISQVENDEEVELAFFFAVVEKRIPAMSSASMNGLDDPSSEYTRETDTLRHALRVLLPGASGNFYKGTLKQFQNFDFDFEWTVSEVYNVEELRVIAFVQYYNDVLKGNSVEQSNFLDITGKSNVVTGIDHIQDILTVYPNPAGDLINLTLPDAPSEDVYWTIYDQSGKQSLKGVIKRGTKIPDPIDSSNLPSGMYIIQLYNEKRVWTPKKVSIAH